MTFVVVLVGWIFSLCLHEFAHAAVAYAGGDTSVREKGYLTFNPLRYVDPVASIFIPLLFLLLGGIGLPGGAVYINQARLRSRYWVTLVSLAGPAANLLLAVLLGLVLKFGVAPPNAAPALAFLGLLQVTALILNLLPIPPLDGYRAISPFLPLPLRFVFNRGRIGHDAGAVPGAVVRPCRLAAVLANDVPRRRRPRHPAPAGADRPAAVQDFLKRSSLRAKRSNPARHTSGTKHCPVMPRECGASSKHRGRSFC